MPAVDHAYDGQWRVVWLSGESAEITLARSAWSLFGHSYLLDLSGETTTFTWTDGTTQTLQRREGDTLHWVTTHRDYPTIRWVRVVRDEDGE